MSYENEEALEEETEEDYSVAIVTSVDRINVPEGGTASFNVKLSDRPEKKRIW